MNIPGMEQLLQQAQEFARRLEQSRAEFAGRTCPASAGGGMVKAVVDGAGRLRDLQIEQQLLSEGDRDMLQDLVLAAVNSALAEFRRARAEQLGGLGGGLLPPGLDWLLGQGG